VTIKALIWDMEGVLLHNRSGDLSTLVAERLGTSVEKTTEIFFGETNDLGDLGRITQDEFWNYVLDQLGKPRSMKPILERIFDEELYVDRDLLDRIHEYHKTYKIGAISNFSSDMREKLDGKWAVSDAFDEVIISCEVGMVKPDPRIYRLMLDKLETAPREAVFIDDRPKNIAGASEVGLHTILFKTKEQALADLEEILQANA
jgi:epoxide hydrolase-like predicted phosphatase